MSRIHNGLTEEITSGLRQKAVDVRTEDFVWNENTTTYPPFKLWCDGEYLLNVVLFGDYDRCLKANDLTNLADYAAELPFSYGANDATIAIVYSTGSTDKANTETGVTAVR